MAQTEAEKKAIKKYQAENIRQVLLKINKKTMPDVFEKLQSVESMQGYIIELIRDDIARNNG